MKLIRIEGPATILSCNGCHRDGIGGSLPFASASQQIVRQPEDWYHDEGTAYCATCSVKLTETDPTRSVSQFYADTDGREIKW